MKLVSLAALAALAACARPSVSDLLARATWVDLTYDFDSTTIYWPTAKPFRLEVVSAQRTAAGYYYAANNIAVLGGGDVVRGVVVAGRGALGRHHLEPEWLGGGPVDRGRVEVVRQVHPRGACEQVADGRARAGGEGGEGGERDEFHSHPFVRCRIRYKRTIMLHNSGGSASSPG